MARATGELEQNAPLEIPIYSKGMLFFQSALSTYNIDQQSRQLYQIDLALDIYAVAVTGHGRFSGHNMY